MAAEEYDQCEELTFKIDKLEQDHAAANETLGDKAANITMSKEEAEKIVGLLGGRRAAAYRATGVPQTKAKQTEDLYVMRYSFDESCVKIGASNKTQQRRCGMQAGHNFWMETLAIFPGKGRHEIPIHGKLHEFFSGRGAGKEWFDIHVSKAVGVVSNLIQELEAEEAKASEKVEPKTLEPYRVV